MSHLSFDNRGVVFRTEYEIQNPSQYFVFVDEDNQRINDSLFRVDVAPGSNAKDQPAKYHNNASNFSFADGHVESHRWQDNIWLKAHTTRLQPGGNDYD